MELKFFITKVKLNYRFGEELMREKPVLIKEEVEEKAELIRVQKKAFYERYPDNVWKEYIHSDEEMKRIRVALDFLINTQNGQDLDDSLLLQEFLKLKNDFVDKNVLVIGSGVGREIDFILENGAKKASGITMGMRNYLFSEDIVGVDQILTDMHMLPFPDEEFDIITAFQVLEHSYAPIVFLLECNRALKVGGIIHIETPPSKCASIDSWLHHVICPTPRQLLCLLLKAGFKPLEFNQLDIDNLKGNEDLDWYDDSSLGVYFKAEKMDPYTYERGDMRRYYEMLAGGSYKY